MPVPSAPTITTPAHSSATAGKFVEALLFCQGQVVLDVGCGTGLCSGLLREKVGPDGWRRWRASKSRAKAGVTSRSCSPRPRGSAGRGNRLEQLTEGLRVREVALGSGYIMTGRAPRTRSQRKSRSWPLLPGGFRVC